MAAKPQEQGRNVGGHYNGFMTKDKKKIVVSLSACLVLAVTLAVWPVRVLEVSLPRKGDRVIAAIRVRVGDRVLIKYRHSVELIEVEGLFLIGPESGLTVVETRFESSGSGLPDSSPERTSRKGGWWVVDEKNRPLEAFRFYIVPINRTRLTVAGKPIPIAALDSGTLIQLKSFKISQIEWLFSMTQSVI